MTERIESVTQSGERRGRGPRFGANMMDVLEASRDLFCVVVNGKITSVNSAGLSLMGAADGIEVERQSFLDMLVPLAGEDELDDGWYERHAFREPLAVRLCRLDGGLRDLQVHVYRARELCPGAYVILGRDVTERSQLLHAVQRTEVRFRLLVENSIHLVLHCRGSVIDYVNRAGVKLLGATDAAQIVGRPVWDLFSGGMRSVLAGNLDLLLAETDIVAVHLARMDGALVDVQMSVTVFPSDGEADFMIEAQDVSEYNRAFNQLLTFNDELERRVIERTAELAQQKSRAEAEHLQAVESKLFVEGLLETIPGPLWFKDADLRFRSYNLAFREANGLAGDEWIGRTLSEVWDNSLAVEHEDMDRALLSSGGKQTCEMPSQFKGGARRDVLMSKTAYRDPAGKTAGVIGMMLDITERKRMESELRRLATTDALTGAGNRRHFLAVVGTELERALRHDRPLSVLMLDIDHFKSINDGYGHAIGDEALQSFVRTCTCTLREHDMLGRLGGEEFAILLPETTLAGAVEVAERLRQLVEESSISLSQGALRLTTSIGVSEVREGDDVSSLLSRADKALYEAKRSGRNLVLPQS